MIVQPSLPWRTRPSPTHIYIYVPELEEIDDDKARRGYAFMYGNADDWDVIRDSHEKSMREAMSEILAGTDTVQARKPAKPKVKLSELRRVKRN